MTTLFQDTFENAAAGSAVSGRTPETGFNVYTWGGTGTLIQEQIDGTKFLQSGGTGLQTRSNSYGDPETDQGMQGTVFEVFFTPGTELQPSDICGDFFFRVSINGQWYAARFRLQGAGWKMSIVAGAGNTESSIVNTAIFFSYDSPVWPAAKMTITETTATLEYRGASCSLSITPVDNTLGFSAISITRGRDLDLADILITNNALITGTGSADFWLPAAALISFGGGRAALSAPTPILSGGSMSSALLSAPSALVAATGTVPGSATSALTGTLPTLLAAGRSSAGDNDFTYTAPRATLSATGGANARLTAPRPALTVTATVTNWGQASISAPSATLSAGATVSGTGQAALTFGFTNGGSYNLIGYGGAVCSVTLTGSPTIQATGTTGAKGGAALTAPLFELIASGTAQNYGSAALVAPAARLGATARAWLIAPGFQLTAIGTAVVVPTYEAYAVNLKHSAPEPIDETTRYTNYPFTHIVRYQNSYYGANSTGLYLLEGTTDDAAPIPWEFKTTITDFESPMAKTAVSAYFAGRMGPAATVGIHLGESGDVSYSHSTPRGPAAQNYRQVFGLGLKARYYALSVAGEGVIELDSVEFNNKTLSRRI